MIFGTRKPTTVWLASAAALAFTAGVLVAKAGPGGATASKLSFSGNVQPRPAAGASVSFAFANTSDGTTCTASAGAPAFDSSGNFVAQVDLSTCTTFAFDGGNVTYVISIDGVAIGGPQPVNPVPYAKYADSAGSAADGGSLQSAIAQLQSQVAALQAAAAGPVSPCPAGYAVEPGTTSAVICKRGSDEVVLVGTGASRFWIDRYEASIWSAPGGQGTEYGATADDYPSTFPVNGEWSVPLYAASVANVRPSTNLTWFRANAACRTSGKRIPTGSEWLSAAHGTPYSPSKCNMLQPNGTPLRNTGAGTCVSLWGAEDMIGNEWELTDEWYAGVGAVADNSMNAERTPWGPDYDDAGTWNVASSALAGPDWGTPTVGLPAATIRGGYTDTTSPGIFAFNLDLSPAQRNSSTGVRCVIPGSSGNAGN